MVTEWLQGLHPAWLALIRVLVWVLPLLILVPGLIWWERRLLSWMQDRIGPNRVATITLKWKWVPEKLKGKKIRLFGLLQPIADGIKLFLKEDVTPNSIDRFIYFVAPAIALFPAFALGGTLPWGPQTGLYGLLTPIADVDIGILYVLAISSLGVYGVVLAGYASNNKYSLLGGLRASAQLISYELAMGVSLACVVLASGSLRLTDMVRTQEAPLWGILNGVQNWNILTPFGFVSAIIFAICVVAETNRAPFDLPEAENELIAGYHTEYSSMKFAVFFMGEYAAMFVFSGVFATVFLGGFHPLPFDWVGLSKIVPDLSGVFNAIAQGEYWLAPLFFIGKCALGITMFIWIRATLPRLRYDQLMSLGWKSLLPLGVANFIVVAISIVVTSIVSEKYGSSTGPWAGLGAALLCGIICLILYMQIIGSKKNPMRGLEKRKVKMVDPSGPGNAEQREQEPVGANS